MAEINSSVEMRDSFDDCILYELLVYAEWKQDPEVLKCSRASGGITNRKSGLNIVQFFRNVDSPDEVRRILLRQLPWHFAVGEGGKVVAILQDTILEIRTSRDEYSSIVGKASIAKDSTPQWRKLCWSPDCSMLALAHSNGVVSFYDLLGSNIFNIYPHKFQENQQPADKNMSICYLGFLQSKRRSSPKWSAELVVVDYHGTLNCYMVSPTEGFQASHSFSFAQHYPHGITTVNYHPSHNMLFVAGPPSYKNLDALKDYGSQLGLTAWRLLNDYPFCTLALSRDEERAIWAAQRSWWNWVPSVTVKTKQSIIFKMQVSPGGKFLACLHSCGSISIWHLPAIRLYKHWNLQEQSDFDARNPLDKRRSDMSNEYICHPVDVNWWSDQAVIVARHSGAISVCSIGNLNNLLGESPEFLAGSPQVSALCSDQGFLGLECETVLCTKKWSWDEHTMVSELESSDDNEEDSDDGDTSLLNRSSALLQSAVYVVTDIERFQPKKKKPKLCYKTYRLLGLKSTTPDELYARKIDNEEYGEALALAKAYNLDCDLVYQQQWRNNKVSVVTIHDYLSKVSKRTWVLKECVERVPDTFGAARELLQFGLQETEIENIFPIDEELISLEDTAENVAAQRLKKIEDIISKVTFTDLTAEQQTLLRYRQQLLSYYDRLCTYELIMGGPHMADEYYEHMFYDKFRTEPLLESAVKFAQESNWKAVEIMFTYHGTVVLPHWLAVLCNFPETMNPHEYRSLLPECDADGNLFQWSEVQLREEDWCEKQNFQDPSRSNTDADFEFIYLEDESLRKFISVDGDISGDTLTTWFIERAYKIESQSCMVDHALTLIKLARERNIMGLEELYNQLLTLDTLVYEVHLEHVRLSDLQKMSQLDVCKLLMSKTSEGTFINDLNNFLLPFLLRCERVISGSRRQLLHSYLTELSSHDLSLPLKMFEYLESEHPNQLVPTLDEKIKLVLDCIYAYPNCDQLSKAFGILQCIPEKSFDILHCIPEKSSGSSSTVGEALYRRLNELECDLHAAEILERNSIRKPLSFIQDNKSSENDVRQLLVRLARNICKRNVSPTEADWKQLLTDILDLQRNCFTSISVESCYEIYAAALLASGNKKNIQSAANILNCTDTSYSSKRISYASSVKLVINGAMEYFDSAGSLEDSSMEMARTCLNLITDENEEIKELQDLISALPLLQDFGITMLPLQVRLCTERLRLVEMCVRSKPLAYRNTQKLFQLANKLQACGKDQRLREGKMLVLIAEAALEALDYQFCADICQQIVAKYHTNGWQVVQKLGQCENYENFSLRRELLGFALLFCPSDLIEVLVNTRCSLEVKIQRENINNQLKQEAVSDDEEFSDALTSPMTPCKEILGYTIITEDMIESPDDSSRDSNCKFALQSFPAFYLSLMPDCHVSNFCTQYDKFSEPVISDPVIRVAQSSLRALQLEGTTLQGKYNNNSKVLLQLAERCLPEDMCLGLCHILPVQDMSVADICFSHLTCSSHALQLACYYFALIGYREINRSVECQKKMYFISPCKLINHMTDVASHLEESTLWAEYLLKYLKLLTDFEQGQKLQDLGCGIDIQRFTQDRQYQQDSILGLAMTIDSEKFSLAVSLALNHDLPVGEVVARHLTSLLLDCEGNHNTDILSQLKSSSLMELMKASPNLICDRLFQYAYHRIEGTDHQLLLSFFTVIQTIAEDNLSYGLTPKEHIKLIRKVKSASSDINYKKLVDSANNILDVIVPALERNNIGMIVKLLKSMPTTLKSMVEPGKLYSAWAQKEFFKVNTSASREDWLEQYELCATHLNKMTAADILEFVKGTCFCERGVDMIPTDCRMTIVTRVKQYCQLKIISPLEDEQDEWNEAIKILDNLLTHLKTVSCLESEDFNSNIEFRQLLRLFDLSRSDSIQINRILQLAVMSDMSVDLLKQFASHLLQPVQTFEQCLTSLLKNTIIKFRCGNDPDEAKLLHAVLQRIQESLKFESSSVPQEVESLCGDSTLPPETRLKALELIQTLKPNAVRNDSMLLYRHTQAIIASCWKQPPVSLEESDLATEEARAELFSKLLKHTSTWWQLIILKELLINWPQFKELNNSQISPWMELTYRMLTSTDREMTEMEQMLDDILRYYKFSESNMKQLVSMAEDSTDYSLLLLLCLLPNDSSLHSTAYDIINKNIHGDGPLLSEKLLSLLLDRGLAPTLITTPVYSQMIEHLLKSHSSDMGLWNSVMNQLISAGHFAEAGMLRLLQMGVSGALSVFPASLALSKTISPEE